MTDEKKTLAKNLSKKLAIGLPVLALSGFVPGLSQFTVDSAHAESDGIHHSEAEAESKYAKPEAEAEAEAEAESKY